jgi:hypothetical protein
MDKEAVLIENIQSIRTDNLNAIMKIIPALISKELLFFVVQFFYLCGDSLLGYKAALVMLMG